MKSPAPTAAAACSISARSASGRPKAMLSRDRPGEEEPFLWDDSELPAERKLRDLAKVRAVDRDAAVARVVEAGEQLRDRRLPGPRVAHESDGGAGRNVEIEVVEDVRELSVAEADVVEADVPANRREVAGVVRIHDLRLLVEDGRDPVECGGRGEEGVVQLRQLLDGVEEVAEVEREGEQRPDRHLARDDQPAADAEDDRRCDGRQNVDGREVHAVEDHRLVVRLAVALVHPAKRRLAGRLARERLDDAHPRDVFGEGRGDEPEAFAHLPVGAVRT